MLLYSRRIQMFNVINMTKCTIVIVLNNEYDLLSVIHHKFLCIFPRTRPMNRCDRCKTNDIRVRHCRPKWAILIFARVCVWGEVVEGEF